MNNAFIVIEIKMEALNRRDTNSTVDRMMIRFIEKQ